MADDFVVWVCASLAILTIGLTLLIAARLTKPHPRKYVQGGGINIKDLIGPEYDEESKMPPEVELLREVVEKMRCSHPNDWTSLQGIEEEVWKAVDGDLDLSAMSTNLTEAQWLANHVSQRMMFPFYTVIIHITNLPTNHACRYTAMQSACG